MNCGHASKLVDAWMDNELDGATAGRIALHVDECPACSALAQQHVAARRCVKERAPYYTAPATFRRRLRVHLEQPAPTSTSVPAASRRRVMQGWRPAAAAAIIAVLSGTLGYLLGRPAAQDVRYEQIVSGHVASLAPTGRLTDVASNERHAVRPWFQGKVDFAPPVRDLSAQGFELIGGRVETLGEQRAAAVVYRLRAHYVTLYAWRDPNGVAASTQAHQLRGFSVATWADAGLRYAAISDVNTIDLLGFAALVQSPQ